MNRRCFQTFTWLMWLALPLMSLRHWQVWDRLPASLAVHFNAANQPDGWMSRAQAFRFDIFLIAFLLTIFTIVVYLSQRGSVTAASWVVLAFCVGMLGVVCYVEESVLEFNLNRRQMDPVPVAIAVTVLAIGLILALVTLGRGRPLAAAELVRQEVQTGKKAALVMLLAVAASLLLATAVPAVRIVMIVLSVILSTTTAMAWDGFHYLFTRHGLEVRTLGFRLKSLPREQIKNYSAVPLCPIAGYGIRGMGGRIAYVWTHRGVRVETNDGWVFLGHPEPEKIVHDLDAMMRAGPAK